MKQFLAVLQYFCFTGFKPFTLISPKRLTVLPVFGGLRRSRLCWKTTCFCSELGGSSARFVAKSINKASMDPTKGIRLSLSPSGLRLLVGFNGILDVIGVVLLLGWDWIKAAILERKLRGLFHIQPAALGLLLIVRRAERHIGFLPDFLWRCRGFGLLGLREVFGLVGGDRHVK